MRGISLWQPWATLVALGAKEMETRSWRTDYVGPLAIAATKTIPREHRGPVDAFIDMPEIQKYLAPLGYTSLATMPSGVVLARCILVRCALASSSWVQDNLERRPWERGMGDYRLGRYAWIFDRVEPTEPTPTKGSQGLYTLDAATALAVLRAPVWKHITGG